MFHGNGMGMQGQREVQVLLSSNHVSSSMSVAWRVFVRYVQK